MTHSFRCHLNRQATTNSILQHCSYWPAPVMVKWVSLCSPGGNRTRPAAGIRFGGLRPAPRSVRRWESFTVRFRCRTSESQTVSNYSQPTPQVFFMSSTVFRFLVAPFITSPRGTSRWFSHSAECDIDLTLTLTLTLTTTLNLLPPISCPSRAHPFSIRPILCTWTKLHC